MAVLNEIVRVIVMLLVMGFGLGFAIAATIQFDNWNKKVKNDHRETV